MLEEVDTDTKYDEYWFTLDGMDNLKESRTFWDLDILSGTMILLSESLQIKAFPFSARRSYKPTSEKRCYITLTIRALSGDHGNRRTFDISADENDTVDGLKQRILLEFRPAQRVKLSHRLKILDGSRTLKEEKLEGGEVLDAVYWLKTSSTSSGIEGPMADSAGFNLEESPAYYSS
jgi:hypothetical protein